MICFNEKHYIQGVWSVPHDPRLPLRERVDWMVCAWCEPDSPTWQVQGRFCQHVSEDTSDQALPDEKEWFQGEWPETLSEEEALEYMDAMATKVSGHLQCPVETVRVQGDVPRFEEVMRARDWNHFRELPPCTYASSAAAGAATNPQPVAPYVPA